MSIISAVAAVAVAAVAVAIAPVATIPVAVAVEVVAILGISGEAMRIFMSTFLFDSLSSIPSGYVKIAIENDYL